MASAEPYANLHLTQSYNYSSTPPLRFLQARCPSCHPISENVLPVKISASHFILYNYFHY